MKAIGLDIGTTSISSACLDMETGLTLKSWTVPNKGFINTKNPWERIQDPEIIMNAALALADEVTNEFADIAVIGLTGQMHGIVYVDAEGKSVSPLYTWQDGRGNLPDGAEGKSLCESLADKYGTPFYTGYGLITHLYNVRHGLVPANAASFCTIMDYLGMQLTGRKKPLVHSSDAASFGFYDIRKNEFKKEMLSEEGVDISLLPEITTKISVLGEYRGIPVTIAIGDNQASFLGSVRNGDEEILINMGTGGQISLLSDVIAEGDDIETRPFIEDSYLVVGSSLCGGRSYALLADFFKACAKEMGVNDFDPYAMMNRMMNRFTVKEPLIVNTAFAGSRDHPERLGSITGISTNNLTPADLTYGMMEGIAEELFTRYKTMLETVKGKHIRMVGSGNGLRKNGYLQRAFIKKFGMELQLSMMSEEASCGTAIAGFSEVSNRSWKQEIGLDK